MATPDLHFGLFCPFTPIFAWRLLAFVTYCSVSFVTAPFTVTGDGARRSQRPRERYRERPTAARLSGGRGIAIRGPAMGAGLGLSAGELPFPVMVIPTRKAFRLTPAKTSVAFSTQRITTNLHMLSLLGGDRLSESVAELYRDGTVLSAGRRAITTFAKEQQERGQSAVRPGRWRPPRSDAVVHWQITTSEHLAEATALCASAPVRGPPFLPGYGWAPDLEQNRVLCVCLCFGITRG
jgi:hypothetical protein